MNLFPATLLLLICLPALAQKETHAILSGRVITGDRLPVAAAFVKVVNSATGTAREGTSDSNGAFSLKTLPLGKSHLSIRAEGFETLEKDIDVQPGMSLEFSLGTTGNQPAASVDASQVPARSEHVQVTATLERRPSDVTIQAGGLPTIVNTVTQEQIEHTNVGRDVGDLLNRVPGVVIASLNQGDIGTGLKGFHCELWTRHVGRVEVDADQPEQSFQRTAARRRNNRFVRPLVSAISTVV